MTNLKNRIILGIMVALLAISPTVTSFGYETVYLTARDSKATSTKAVKTNVCSVDGKVA